MSSKAGAGLAGPAALLAILAALVFAAGGTMQRLEFALYDLFQKQQSLEPSDRILLVNSSLGATTDSLWEDARVPEAIASLKAAGAAVIIPTTPMPANDPLPNLDQLSNLLELERRANPGGAKDRSREVANLSSQLELFRQQAENRIAVEAALAESGIGVVALTPTNPRSTASTNECAALGVLASDETRDRVPPAREFLTLPSELCKGAASAGYAGFRPDPDGVVRSNALIVRSGERIAPSLAVAALATGTQSLPVTSPAVNQLAFGDVTFATGTDYTVLNRFYTPGTNGLFEQVSLESLLAEGVDPAEVAGRIALLGPLNGEPVYRTPVTGAMPDSQLLATNLSNLIQQDFLLRPGWLSWVELAVVLGIAALALIFVPGLSMTANAVSVAGTAIVLMTAELYLLSAHGIWVKFGLPTIFAVFAATAIYAIRALQLRPAAMLPMAAPQPAMGQISNEEELDLAFSVLRQQSPTDDTKDKLYSIAVTHGRRREFAKAERVLRYLASIDPDYRGVQDKLKKLSGARQKKEAAEETEKPQAPVKRALDSNGQIRSLGRYEIDDVLGRGAMATVYLGRDPAINRKVAIKTIALAEEFSDDDLAAAKEQFLREAESAGRLNHANIITIYDVGEDNEVAYLAMEYFKGKSLSFYAQAENMLPPGWVLELGSRAAEALHYAHSQKVVHRDIKPANILFDAASDSLKLTDFGIARLTDTSRTKTGIILGTPSYMSPEQLSGAAVTGQSDLYSLGITLYHLLTGAPPFRADSIPKLMDKIVNERHAALANVRDDLSPAVDEFFDRALAKDPADRFANGRAMALALKDSCSSLVR